MRLLLTQTTGFSGKLLDFCFQIGTCDHTSRIIHSFQIYHHCHQQMPYYLCMQVCMCMCMYVCVCVYACVYVCVCMCMYVCVSVCVYVCVCVCVCMHTINYSFSCVHMLNRGLFSCHLYILWFTIDHVDSLCDVTSPVDD